MVRQPMVKTPLNFDENAGAKLLADARVAMVAALDCSANASSVHSAGRRARGIVEAAREHVGTLCSVGKDHVIFGRQSLTAVGSGGGTRVGRYVLRRRASCGPVLARNRAGASRPGLER